MPRVSRLERGHDFHGEVAFGNGHGDAGHFFQVGDHIVESSGQSADFVVAMNIDVLIEVAGIANFARDGDEVRERLADGLGGLDRPRRCRRDRRRSVPKVVKPILM